MYVKSICILRLWYVWLVACRGQLYAVWRSVVCGGNWYVGIRAKWGKWHGRSVVCEASGMLGQQYTWSQWRGRSVSGV